MDRYTNVIKGRRPLFFLSTFHNTFIKLVNEMRADFKAALEKDPAARSGFELLTCYPGFQAVAIYRIAHVLHENCFFWPARFLSNFSRFLTGVEIHPGAQIGRGLFIDHGMGVVIGETAIVGDDVLIYHGATLGSTGKQQRKRHPTLGNKVIIGACAQVLGNIEIGDNALIGAGAVVLHSVAENCTAVGVPAKVVIRAGQRVQALSSVESQLSELDRKLKILENRLDQCHPLINSRTDLAQLEESSWK